MALKNTSQPIPSVEHFDIDFPARINVSFALSEPVLNLVRLLNSVLLADGFGDIDFSRSAASIPHITLLMGQVATRENLAQIEKCLRQYAATGLSIDYRISKPYLRKPSRNFVFVDTLPQQAFRSIRTALHRVLSGSIDCESHGGPDNVSHVTIGYCHPTYPVVEKLVSRWKPISGVADLIQIAQVGRRGTCNKVLATVKMGRS